MSRLALRLSRREESSKKKIMVKNTLTLDLRVLIIKVICILENTIITYHALTSRLSLNYK